MLRADVRGLPDSCGNTAVSIRGCIWEWETDSEAGKTAGTFV